MVSVQSTIQFQFHQRRERLLRANHPILCLLLAPEPNVSSRSSFAARFVSKLLAGPNNESLNDPQGFFKHKPTVGDVPHFAPSGAPPLGQKTDTRVSLDSQLTDPSAWTARTFVVVASPLSPLSPLSPGAPCGPCGP